MALGAVFSFFLFVLFASSVCAQADQMLRDAYNRLLAAGSYEWLDTHLLEGSGRAHRQTRATGSTVVDGHTVATFGGIEAVFLGENAVFELKAGWRHIRDLSDGDVFELEGRRPPYFMNRREGPDGFRRYVYLPVHDLLWWLLTNATALRIDGSTVVGDLPQEAENTVRVGKLPVAALPAVLRGVIRRPPAGAPRNRTATLTVWLSGGNITKFACEFAFTGSVNSGDRNAGSLPVFRNEYAYELGNLGRAKVNVPAEVKAILAAK